MSAPRSEVDDLAFWQALLHQVRTGAVQPADADEQSRQKTGERLSRLIPPEEHHAAASNYWSLPMVLAWIAWRTYAEVREWDAEHLKMCRYWAEVRPGGVGMPKAYDLCRRRPPNSDQFERWGHLQLGYWRVGMDGGPANLLFVEPENTRWSLWNALEKGSVAAFGVPKGAGTRAKIHPHEWIDLRARVASNGLDEFYNEHARTAAAYIDVCFSREDTEARWLGGCRSDVPDQADIDWYAPPEDEKAFSGLYEWLSPDDLTGSLAGKSNGRSRRARTDGDLKELIEANRARVRKGEKPMTVNETVMWGAKRGVGRAQVRELRTDLPDDLKRRQGDRSS